MSILHAVIGCFSNTPGGVAEDAATLDSPWSGIVATWPNNNATSGDKTVTWTVGGSRAISINYGGDGIVSYRINSGSYVSYSGAFFLQSGQTLGWRVWFVDNETSQIIVTETGISSRTLGTISTNAVGWPLL